MKLLTIFAAAVAALAMGGAVIHQHGGDMAEHLAMIARHLNLTPTQEKQFKSEHSLAEKKLAALDADPSLDAKGKDQARARLHNEMMAKAKTILTPVQMKKLTALHESMNPLHDAMRIMDQIGLRADQKAKVHEVLSKAASAMEAIQFDAKLSDAQRQAKTQDLHMETMQEIHAILTPEQIEKAKSLHHAGGDGGHSKAAILH